MIEIYLLEQLAGFARYGTLSETAAHLHTSQPALTRSMKKLEDQLGVSLFYRSRNRLSLNETGQFAAASAMRILQDNQEFERQVRAFDRRCHTISIGYCAPVPQSVLTPMLNNAFEGMTLSADLKDDVDFPDRLLDETYQLAVTHYPLDDARFCCKKCGHEDLSLSVWPSSPLAKFPILHLQYLDRMSILLLTQIGFWTNIPKQKAPNTHYLLQIEQDSFSELATHSDYPCFSSSYEIRRGQLPDGKCNMALADEECHTDYYLSCLMKNAATYQALFSQITDSTIL